MRAGVFVDAFPRTHTMAKKFIYSKNDDESESLSAVLSILWLFHIQIPLFYGIVLVDSISKLQNISAVAKVTNSVKSEENSESNHVILPNVS